MKMLARKILKVPSIEDIFSIGLAYLSPGHRRVGARVGVNIFSVSFECFGMEILVILPVIVRGPYSAH
jgi:hypothetical protein